eukprot:scaffold66867_cov57-Phaeocystis_antarctica.AAC.1
MQVPAAAADAQAGASAEAGAAPPHIRRCSVFTVSCAVSVAAGAAPVDAAAAGAAAAGAALSAQLLDPSLSLRLSGGQAAA